MTLEIGVGLVFSCLAAAAAWLLKDWWGNHVEKIAAAKKDAKEALDQAVKLAEEARGRAEKVESEMRQEIEKIRAEQHAAMSKAWARMDEREKDFREYQIKVAETYVAKDALREALAPIQKQLEFISSRIIGGGS